MLVHHYKFSKPLVWVLPSMDLLSSLGLVHELQLCVSLYAIASMYQDSNCIATS